MTVHFSCTMCGKCCHGLRLPLSLSEAGEWLRRGGDVQLFCEAIPWPVEPEESNLQARHKRRRSFAALSGDLPIRVVVSVVASFDGPCPNLLPDMRCGAYEARPLACRIYPAEVNPFIELVPASKSCPSEAWAADQPTFLQGGRLVNSATVIAAERFRLNDYHDAGTRARLCDELGIGVASLANEAFVIHSIQRDVMTDALARIDRDAGAGVEPANWQFVTNNTSTREILLEIGAHVYAHETASSSRTMQYLAF